MGILNLLQFRTNIPKRMNFFAALLLASAFVATFASDFDREVDVHWEEYESHSPKHHHKTEEGARKENFKKSHKLIDDHNKGGNNFTMEHNHISDMHDHEKEHLYGLKMPVGMRTPVWTPSDAAQTRYLPSSVDYRTDACLQPIRNQGSCGSCWSFASVAPLIQRLQKSRQICCIERTTLGRLRSQQPRLQRWMVHQRLVLPSEQRWIRKGIRLYLHRN